MTRVLIGLAWTTCTIVEAWRVGVRVGRWLYDASHPAEYIPIDRARRTRWDMDDADVSR